MLLRKSAGILLVCVLALAQLSAPVAARLATAKGETPREVRLGASIDTITGTLRGRVIDEQGNGVPLVTVRAVNLETGNARATKTNALGEYSIAALPLGRYNIVASKEGLRVVIPTRTPVTVQLNKTVETVPDITMAPVIAGGPPPPPPTPTPAPTDPGTTGKLANQLDAARRTNISEKELVTLALPDSRTFDTLASLAAGVAPPPQVKGVVGPGIGSGIGTAGQFAVNGQRARSNNFTVDGSDNNDEDVGVRRQGFAALVPQTIESVREVQTVTHLWDAESGRSSGSQVNAVSKSGTNQVHGILYDFFNHSAFNARNFFDYTSDKAQSYALSALAFDRYDNGVPVNPHLVPVVLRNSVQEQPRQLVQPNPSLGKDRFQRNQGGGVIGFPIIPNRTFFFGSFEHQDIKAQQETHYSVPTVAQRGFLNFGATGFSAADQLGRRQTFTPTFVAGDAVFALFPLPNNPIGPYGGNTYTQVLPGNGDALIFSAKVDHSFSAWGNDNQATVRYNFTNDERLVPAVGGALFSSILPRVGTQNVSLFLNTQLATNWANQLRASFGRTLLRFDENRDPYLTPSQYAPGTPYLLNAGFYGNQSTPQFPLPYVDYQRTGRTVDDQLGTVGQVIVAPFSPAGLDVNLFPQARANNTIQAANTLTQFHNDHTFKYGFDIRRTQLNSFLNRNFRPQVVFGGGPDLTRLFPTAPILTPSSFGPTPGFFSGSDLAALGLPTSISQALSIGTPDSTVGLRFWQLNFFFNDNWRARRGLTFDYGLRYELNSVPGEVSKRIEKTFALNQLPPNNPDLALAAPFSRTTVLYDPQRLLGSLNATLDAYRGILGGRERIYDPDRNNFGPHFSLAWDPFSGSKTQAGKTAIRAGAGVYYDLTLGSVVSQSRNVFPTFVPVNIDVNTFLYAQNAFFDAGNTGAFGIFNPNFIPVRVVSETGTRDFGLVAPNRLNAVSVPSGVVQQLLGLLFDTSNAGVRPSGGGLAFTLPDRRLRTAYTTQYNLQFEREFFDDYLFNIAYVGARGTKLVRFRTPNGGPNSVTIPVDPLGLTRDPILAIALPPLGNLTSPNPTRLNPRLGAYTLFDSSAASNYHSLQTSLTKRFAQGFQFSAAYTWSHAIDDVSDVFDVAGAFVFAQDDRNLLAERASANFDIRHRFVYSLVAELPYLRRFNNAKGAAGFFLGGWQYSSISTYQTGQPFTVNTSYDINLDGNLTDRLDTLNGLTEVDTRRQRLSLTGRSLSLLAPLGSSGRIGRNAFRASGVAKTDAALLKTFRIREGQSLLFRVEAFNLFNRTHFAIPVRILEAPSFGSSVDTLLNARQIQFALKYVF